MDCLAVHPRQAHQPSQTGGPTRMDDRIAPRASPDDLDGLITHHERPHHLEPVDSSGLPATLTSQTGHPERFTPLEDPFDSTDQADLPHGLRAWARWTVCFALVARVLLP